MTASLPRFPSLPWFPAPTLHQVKALNPGIDLKKVKDGQQIILPEGKYTKVPTQPPEPAESRAPPPPCAACPRFPGVPGSEYRGV